MHTTQTSNTNPNGKPVFGFIMIGGGLSGAMIRDARIANELASRGFDVHVWWALDYPQDNPLDPAIKQHILYPALRYARQSARLLFDLAGRYINRFVSDQSRTLSIQKRPEMLANIMGNLIRVIIEGIESDPAPLNRFLKQATQARVTHFLPMLGLLAPYARHAQQHIPTHPKYLVTFQGYELYVQYAKPIGLEQELYKILRTVTAQSDFPALAVSEDYRQRVIEDIQIPAQSIVPLPPGVIARPTMSRDQGIKVLTESFVAFEPDLPLISFVGRRDTEKGIDLLLYAANILRRRGLDTGVIVAGPTLFGYHYAEVIARLRAELRFDRVLLRNKITNELRDALFTASDIIIYPSVHREPFGMVPVEAAAFGTPAIVPNYGGIQETVQVDDLQCGLHFEAFDSGDLADKIESLLTDHDLYKRLSADGPKIAEHYSIQNITDRLLQHMTLPTNPLTRTFPAPFCSNFCAPADTSLHDPQALPRHRLAHRTPRPRRLGTRHRRHPCHRPHRPRPRPPRGPRTRPPARPTQPHPLFPANPARQLPHTPQLTRPQRPHPPHPSRLARTPPQAHRHSAPRHLPPPPPLRPAPPRPMDHPPPHTISLAHAPILDTRFIQLSTGPHRPYLLGLGALLAGASLLTSLRKTASP